MNRFSVLAVTAAMAAPAMATDLAATLQWSQRVELAAPVSGVVQTVYVNIGDRVKKGQALVALDATDYSAGVAEAKADVAHAREEERDAKRNLDRVQELYNRTVISMTELEQAQLRNVRARSRLQEAQAKLTMNQKKLRDATVRAPFDGVVLARQVEPGQAVASQLQPQPLVVIARAGEMVARARAGLAQLDQLKVGQVATVVVGQRNYRGKIGTLGLEPIADKEAGKAEYLVDVLFPVQDVLRAGTPATVRIP